MLSIILIGVLLGYHLALVLGGTGLVFGYLLWGNTVFQLLYQRFYALLLVYAFLAVPLFVYMGVMLERSGVAAKLYDAIYLWLGGLRGGLALTTVIIGTILAACVGIIGASVTMLSIVALPAMMKRGYDRSLACGSICAGGTLGILIPPSVMLVTYGPMAEVSVGRLFMGAIVPGLLLSALYCSYIAIRSLIQPQVAPAVPPEERRVPFIRKTTLLIKAVLPTAAIILSVLGSIFFGLAPPTEAGAVGAFAATLLAIAYRKFDFFTLKDSILKTTHLTAMIVLIAAMSFSFVGVFMSAGCGKVITNLMLNAPGGRWGVFAVIMFIIFILGFIIDWIGIVFIMVPLLVPVIPALGFDPLWFGIMLCVNLQMSFMTPPLAGALFFLKASADPKYGITMAEIIKGVIPFIALIMVCLVLCIFFPQIITWLPNMMIK
ncbi:TRAP transporter large permease subunit [Chloroflexota bacterium]